MSETWVEGKEWDAVKKNMPKCCRWNMQKAKEGEFQGYLYESNDFGGEKGSNRGGSGEKLEGEGLDGMEEKSWKGDDHAGEYEWRK